MQSYDSVMGLHQLGLLLVQPGIALGTGGDPKVRKTKAAHKVYYYGGGPALRCDAITVRRNRFGGGDPG